MDLTSLKTRLKSALHFSGILVVFVNFIARH